MFQMVKQGCKAHIRFELSSDCQSLQVTEINEDHNHEVCKVRHIQLFVSLHD